MIENSKKIPQEYEDIFNYFCSRNADMIDLLQLNQFLEKCGLTKSQINILKKECNLGKKVVLDKEKFFSYLAIAAFLLKGDKNVTRQSLERVDEFPNLKIPLYLKKNIQNNEANDILDFDLFYSGDSITKIISNEKMINFEHLNPHPNKIVANNENKSILDNQFDFSFLDTTKNSNECTSQTPEMNKTLTFDFSYEDAKTYDDLISNRYGVFDNYEIKDVYISNWIKCLLEINKCLSKTAEIIDKYNLNTSEIKLAFDEEKTIQHFKALYHMYAILSRIDYSSIKTGKFLESFKLQNLISEGKKKWSIINDFIYLSKYLAIPTEKQSECEYRCGICLGSTCTYSGSISDPSIGKRKPIEYIYSDDLHLINFTNFWYHAPCANFWLHKIDLTLPRLTQINPSNSLL